VRAAAGGAKGPEQEAKCSTGCTRQQSARAAGRRAGKQGVLAR